MTRTDRILAGIFLAYSAVLLAVGASIHWYVTRPDPVAVAGETAAPAVVQPDGSRILERQAQAEAQAAKEPPPHAIPPGGKEVRRIRAVVQPKAKPELPADLPAECRAQLQELSCPPLRLDLSLVRDATGFRAVASSPDGTVVDGLDIPVADLLPPTYPWAAGLTFSPQSDTLGAFVDRDFGRARIGAELNDTEEHGIEARLRLGFRF